MSVLNDVYNPIPFTKANSTTKPTPLPCLPSCDVEAGSLALLKELRSINPKLTTMLYINTLLLFPFYSLAGKYLADAENALLMDAVTGGPITLKNDDGMYA